MPEPPSVAAAVEGYSHIVGELKEGKATALQVLAALLARDAVERALRATPLESPAAAQKLVAADRTMAELRFPRFNREIAQWRRSLRPPEEAWWWFPVRGRRSAPERTLNVLSLVLFPVSLAIAIDFSHKMGAEALGVASLLPIVAAALGSISAGRFYSAGDQLGETLDDLGWGRSWLLPLSGTILLLLVAISSTPLFYPRLAAHFERRGAAEISSAIHGRARWDLGRINLERAVRFDPGNSFAHYRLGFLYENLLEDDKAMTEYRIAYAGGLDLAANNLGRLYLQKKDYDRAAFVLQKSLAELPATIEPEVRYTMLKNLGWARVGQNRFGEARGLLGEAIQLSGKRSAAHCLLAKSLAGLGETQEAAQEFSLCLGYRTAREFDDPEEDTWLGEARAFLKGTSGVK